MEIHFFTREDETFEIKVSEFHEIQNSPDFHETHLRAESTIGPLG
jgi:hypothetical protein